MVIYVYVISMTISGNRKVGGGGDILECVKIHAIYLVLFLGNCNLPMLNDMK